MQSENYKLLKSRMKVINRERDSTSGVGASPKFSMRNPMIGGPASPVVAGNADLDKSSLSAQDPNTLAMQLEMESDHKSILDRVRTPLPKIALAVISAVREIFKKPRLQDFIDSLFKRRILLHRACLALVRRFELIIGSVVLHIILGLLFAWINKSITPASAIAYFGISAMFLIMANVQFIFFVYTNHHVSLFLFAFQFFKKVCTCVFLVYLCSHRCASTLLLVASLLIPCMNLSLFPGVPQGALSRPVLGLHKLHGVLRAYVPAEGPQRLDVRSDLVGHYGR
jgi:hypothetical protein